MTEHPEAEKGHREVFTSERRKQGRDVESKAIVHRRVHPRLIFEPYLKIKPVCMCVCVHVCVCLCVCACLQRTLVI